MVASVQNPSRDVKERTTTTTEGLPTKKALTNRVLAILMRRLYSTKTFGENLIFMLNRAGILGHLPLSICSVLIRPCLADDSDEDLCVQLLILKMLYLLFTTPGAQEYFYTNDLRVLIDVFVRALNNLSEENESVSSTGLFEPSEWADSIYRCDTRISESSILFLIIRSFEQTRTNPS
jgi:SPIN90/Ldb17, leucine-rich domain